VYLAVKRSRVPVLVGVGSPTLDASAALAREAAGAGAYALLLPPPSFYHYEPDEIAEFCRQILRQVDSQTPVLLYNTPLSTSALPADAAIRLLEGGRFAGIVDASADP